MNNISNDMPSNPNSSRIANMPYFDHVTELKYLRNNKPEMFNTTNEMSHKKLPQVEQNVEGKKNYDEEPVENVASYVKKSYF